MGDVEAASVRPEDELGHAMVAGERIQVSELQVKRIRPAYHQVAEQVRDLILSGMLRPGDRLPGEQALGDMFGVSRSTVREALRSMSSESLIRTTRGRSGGTFVERPSTSQVSGQLASSIMLLSGASELSVEELIEARVLLEAPAARLAAGRRTKEDLADLGQAVESDFAVLTNLKAPDERHVFHQAVLEASGNRLLSILTRPVFIVLHSRFLSYPRNRDHIRGIAEEHREVWDRIAAQDGAGAEEAMTQHLHRLHRLYNDVVQEDA